MRNNEIAIIKVRLLHKNLPTRSNVKIILIALEQFVKMHKKKQIPGNRFLDTIVHHKDTSNTKQSVTQ